MEAEAAAATKVVEGEKRLRIGTAEEVQCSSVQCKVWGDWSRVNKQ